MDNYPQLQGDLLQDFIDRDEVAEMYEDYPELRPKHWERDADYQKINFPTEVL